MRRMVQIEERKMDNFTKHRLNDGVILRAQQRAGYRKPYRNTLRDDTSRAAQPRPPARGPRGDWPDDAIDPQDPW